MSSFRPLLVWVSAATLVLLCTGASSVNESLSAMATTRAEGLHPPAHCSTSDSGPHQSPYEVGTVALGELDEEDDDDPDGFGAHPTRPGSRLLQGDDDARDGEAIEAAALRPLLRHAPKTSPPSSTSTR